MKRATPLTSRRPPLAVWALGFMLGLGCASNDFAGDSGKEAAWRKTIEPGDGTDGGPDGSVGSDGSLGGAGGKGSEGGGANGNGSDQPGDGGPGGTGPGGGGPGGPGGNGSDGGTLGADGGGLNGDDTKKPYHDGTIKRLKWDEPFTLIVETLVKGKIMHSTTLTYGDSGQAREGTTLKGVCRTAQDTCLRLSFKGEVDQVMGASACTKLLSNNGNSATVHVDMDGEGLIGSCLVGSDETLELTCPLSKSLKVENCNG